MRTRLLVVFLVPLIGVLLVLGGAYAWSAARSIQQEFYNTQLGDLGYFVTSARQALLSGNSTVLEGEAQRYSDLFGTVIVVVDRAGVPFVSDGSALTVFDEETEAQLRLALSGRRAELPAAVLPWSTADAVLVEPVFNDGDVIGAVVVSTSVDAPRAEIIQHWLLLGVLSLLGTAAGILLVLRLVNWVLQPVHRLDRAMEAIEKGDMDARIADDTGPPELRRMILLFNTMAAEIERVVSRQQEFALNASHELRNPLNALLLRVEYLATGLDESWDHDVEQTREEGRRMTRILDTLLNLARSGSGDSALTVIDVAQLARQRVEAWSQVAAREGVRFEVNGDRTVLSLADSTIVESALDAVVDNAVKFSPRGSVVEVSARRVGEGGEIVVRDYGPGLAADELERAADRFWRSPGSQNLPGSGLGLAIASDLLSSINGQLLMDAPEGGGLRVSLRLSAERTVGVVSR